jgi:hypothetical protein
MPNSPATPPGAELIVEENTASDEVVLTADQIARLDTLTPAAGARHDDGNIASIDQ